MPAMPASITIRPIFNPSARTNDVSPSAVGGAASTGAALTAAPLAGRRFDVDVVATRATGFVPAPAAGAAPEGIGFATGTSAAAGATRFERGT